MKPIKKTKPREGLAPGPSGGRGGGWFSISTSWVLRSEKPELFIQNMTTLGYRRC